MVYYFVVVVWSPRHVLLFCDPMDCIPPGPSVHGISQARILEWVAISVSRGCCLALAGEFFTSEPQGKPPKCNKNMIYYLFTIVLLTIVL